MNKTNYLLGTLALSAMVGLANCGGRRPHLDSEGSTQPSANVTSPPEYQQYQKEKEDSALKENTELKAKIRKEDPAACKKRIAALPPQISPIPPKPVEDKFLPDLDKPVHLFLKALAEGKYDYLPNLNDDELNEGKGTEKKFFSYFVINKSQFSLAFNEPCPKEKQCVEYISFKYYRDNGSYELGYFLNKKVITKDAQGEHDRGKDWGVTYEGKGQGLNYDELTEIILNEYIEPKNAEHDGEQRVINLNPKQVNTEYKSVFTKQLSNIQERCDLLMKERAKLPSPL